VLRLRGKCRRCLSCESNGSLYSDCTDGYLSAAISVKGKRMYCILSNTIQASHFAIYIRMLLQDSVLTTFRRADQWPALHPDRHAHRAFSVPGSFTVSNSARRASALLRIPAGNARAGISLGSISGSEWKTAGRIEAFHKCVRRLCSTVYSTKLKTSAMTAAG